MTHPDATLRLRKLAYTLLITVATGVVAGHILSAERVNEPSLHKPDRDDPRPLSVWPKELPPALPTFSSNDRSRWATIRALVDHGTYATGVREEKDGKYADRSIWRESGWEPGWDTVDKVLDPNTKKFYSSKPPLLSTVLAGLYWLLQQITGWTLASNVWEVIRTMLLLVNLIPFVIYLGLLTRLGERYARTDYAKLFLLAAACFATLVTPFLITLNNHTIAAFCVLFATYAALVIWDQKRWGAGQAPSYLFVAAGFFASFAACIEMPALAFTVGVGLVLLLRSPGRTLLFFAPAALIPIAGFFATNYVATGQLIPVQAEFGSDWYMYKDSHWQNPAGTKRGIDFARNYESRGEYALNVLVGHHGLFSLTPLWLLALAGMVLGLIQLARPPEDTDASSPAVEETNPPARLPWWFFPAALLLSLVVIGFYLVKTDNYGGWTMGLRWLMWLIPIWLVCLLPALDKLACCRWGRGLGYVLLALSILSASYAPWNPWRHPWLFRLMDAHGWVPY